MRSWTEYRLVYVKDGRRKWIVEDWTALDGSESFADEGSEQG